MTLSPQRPAARQPGPIVNPRHPRWAQWGLLALIATAGCATPPAKRYAPPISGPVAKMAIRTQLAGADAYGVYLFGDGDNCKDAQLAATGRPLGDAPPAVTLSAGSGRWTTVEFFSVHPGKRYCMVRWSFQPVAGRTYLLSSATSGTACIANVLDATNPDSIKKESTAVRRNGAGSACIPLAVAQAAKAKNADRSAAAVPSDEATLMNGTSTDDLKGLIGQ